MVSFLDIINNENINVNDVPPRGLTTNIRKTCRSYVNPTIRLEAVTAPEAVEALMIVARNSTGTPEPGTEMERINTLLRRSARWAKAVSPKLAISQFITASQKLTGNRQLRPYLADVRLAEMRGVRARRLEAEQDAMLLQEPTAQPLAQESIQDGAKKAAEVAKDSSSRQENNLNAVPNHVISCNDAGVAIRADVGPSIDDLPMDEEARPFAQEWEEPEIENGPDWV